jgi:hypothetical protein
MTSFLKMTSAARGEASANLNTVKYLGEDNKLSITLKLEGTISKKSTQEYPDNQKSSRKLVLLTMTVMNKSRRQQ